MRGLGIILKSLAAHRTRALLAMLGVFLGALALTAVMHVAGAMVLKADLETQKLGPNLLQALSGQVRFRRDGPSGVSGVNRTFTLQDAEAILGGVAQVRDGVPYCNAPMPVRYGSIKTTSQLVATLPGFARVRAYSPAYGRFISDEDEAGRALVCVLGTAIATRLFERPDNAVGRTVFFFRAPVQVVGVMEEKGQDVSGTNLDEQVYVPLSTYMRRMANQDWISGVYMNLHDGADEEAARAAVTAILRSRHLIAAGQKDDFSVLSARDANKLRKEALDLVQTLGVLSSSISFAMGSLGILSIMTLLVRARRLEIGVRRAVGASRNVIVRQFLAEAGLMAGVGGTLGVVVALALVTVVYAVGDFPYTYDPLLAAGACIASVVLGVAAGAYPAWQASRVDVLDVLRHPE